MNRTEHATFSILSFFGRTLGIQVFSNKKTKLIKIKIPKESPKRQN
jgi:hypothetical protein